ncbi:MAG: hypothetical protein ICV79_04310 [Flavisolibacter sp.]|nr:hypothetical protein [Flavisolibacter sp.]
MSLDQQFSNVSEKLQQLLRQHARVRKENDELKQMLQLSKEEQVKTQQQITELHQQIAILKMAAGEMEIKDKKDFEKQINQYIRDIDKCIAYLSR